MLKNMGFFWTPKTAAELQEYVAKLPMGETRALANAIMGFTWNLCAELTKDAIHQDAAFMLQYLARGVDYRVEGHEAYVGEFNEWLTGDGDLERSEWLQKLAVEMQKALPEDLLDVSWGELNSVVIEREIADEIVGPFVKGETTPPAQSELVKEFKRRIGEQRGQTNQTN